MIWQDYVVAIVNFVFAAALIPSIVKNQQPHMSTCVITGAGLSVLSMTFATLDLTLSCVGVSMGALGWWIMSAQSTIKTWRAQKATQDDRKPVFPGPAT